MNKKINWEFFSEKYKLYGWTGFIEYILKKTILKLFHFRIATFYIYSKPIDFVNCINSTFSHKEISYSDFLTQRERNQKWFDDYKMSNLKWAMTKRNNTAIGIYDHDLLIAYGLIDFNNFVLLSYPLHEHDVYFWDDYVHPAYRGQRLHELITHLRIEEVKKHSKTTRVLSYIDSFNRASKRAHEREGFQLIQKFRIMQFHKHRHCSFKYPE